MSPMIWVSVLCLCSLSSAVQIISMPKDGNCLFHSIGYIVNKSGRPDVHSPSDMRSIIATIVESDNVTYSDGILGRADYSKWIMNESNWGGEVEINILARYYDIQLKVLDVRRRAVRGPYNPHSLWVSYLHYTGDHYNVIENQQGDCIFPSGATFDQDGTSLPVESGFHYRDVAFARLSVMSKDESTLFLRQCIVCDDTTLTIAAELAFLCMRKFQDFAIPWSNDPEISRRFSVFLLRRSIALLQPVQEIHQDVPDDISLVDIASRLTGIINALDAARAVRSSNRRNVLSKCFFAASVAFKSSPRREILLDNISHMITTLR